MLRRKVAAYVTLTKPRIIELLLITTVPTMILAHYSVRTDNSLLPGWDLMAATAIGGFLAAAGANTINMIVDRDIDKLMERTQDRPLVTGVITPRQAAIFATLLSVGSFMLLWSLVNLLSAVLASAALAFYVLVYTIWLKRKSVRNIVIGGAAGAVPVLVGWAAVTNTLDWAPIVLFAVIFYWTPPHFWALAIHYHDDYTAAKVPMLPAVVGVPATARKIVAYSVALWALTILFAPVASMGILYWVAAVVLGAGFVIPAISVMRNPQPERALQLFHWSITYLVLLFVAITADVLIRAQNHP